MAVTKTSVVSVFFVLAITYNQGAARPAKDYLTNNEVSSSEEPEHFEKFMLPTVLEKGLVITLKGTIDMKSPFIVELPSTSGKEPCRIEYKYNDENIIITPAVDGYESAEYSLADAKSGENPSFTLSIVARVDKQNNHIVGMTFFNKNVGPSSQLICRVDNFNDINQILIKSGVASVNSLLFEFQ